MYGCSIIPRLHRVHGGKSSREPMIHPVLRLPLICAIKKAVVHWIRILTKVMAYNAGIPVRTNRCARAEGGCPSDSAHRSRGIGEARIPCDQDPDGLIRIDHGTEKCLEIPTLPAAISIRTEKKKKFSADRFGRSLHSCVQRRISGTSLNDQSPCCGLYDFLDSDTRCSFHKMERTLPDIHDGDS